MIGITGPHPAGKRPPSAGTLRGAAMLAGAGIFGFCCGGPLGALLLTGYNMKRQQTWDRFCGDVKF